MKKILLAGTALVGLAFASSPASAEINMDLGGYFRGYGVFADQDDDFGGVGVSADLREFDFRKDAEIHFTGETTTDSGLTVGAHYEMDLGAEPNDTTDEAYLYASGGWGRVNFGQEDGAAYLLQVAAPSADSNVDGLRTQIEGVNGLNGGEWGYDNADFRQTDRLTYLSPKFSGFQAGVSYAPENGANAIGNNVAGMATDNDLNDFEDLWEVAARWDGEFEGFGISAGAGYSNADIETSTGAILGDYADDLTTWDVGLNVSFNSFSVGGAYIASDTELSNGVTGVDVESDVWVVGVGYDNGPYHAGLSYFDGNVETAGAEADGTRWTAGGGYTYGPGMTFRGAVSLFNEDLSDLGSTDENATQVTIGTDVQF